MSFVFKPGETADSDQLGGKARALASLHGSGLSIPEWFVLLPHAFAASLSREELQALAEEGMPTKADAILTRLQLTPSVMRELSSALAKLCPAGERVAVRSSALDEDGGKYSFAGQLESFLMVPPTEVAARVVAVWKSAFSERVRAYRTVHQITGTPPPPAVLIQRMVHAEAAGVAFGTDPISGRNEFAVVSAVRGLGTALVNGERDADTWQVDASGGICQRQLANPEHRPSPVDALGDRSQIGLSPPRRPVLTDAQVCAVATLVRRTGEIFGSPQDVEWAFANGHLYLLQSRPITVTANRGNPTIWDNSNIIESYSGVTGPLTFSFATRAYTGVYRQFCQMLAVPKAKIAAHDPTFRHMLGLIRGRVYYNLLNWYRVLALLPGFTLNRRFMEQMMGVKEELPAEVLAELGPATVSGRLRDGLDVTFSLAALVTNHFLLPRTIRRFYARLNAALAPPARPLETLPARELAAHFLDLEKKLLTRWDAPLLNDFFAMIFYGVLRRLLAKWVHDSEGNLQNDLLCGEGGMISAEPAERIRALAELATPHPDLVVQLCDGSLSAIVAALDDVPKFHSAYCEYLVKFGDRCLGELKLESLTLHDDPLLLFRSVGQLARRKVSAATPPVPTSVKDPRRCAEARVRQALEGQAGRRVVFRWVLRHTRTRVRDRENLRFERTRLFGRVRRIFVEMGRRLHGTGDLSDPRDVFFLEVDEVLAFVAGTLPKTNLKELVVHRQREFLEYHATEPPPNRFTTYGVAHGHPSSLSVSPVPPGGEAPQRKGIGCCPGVVRGRVRRILDPRNAVIQPGEILVAERTDPGWILLFPTAAGLLIERGSLLSHSAIVAREMRIPAIVSIEGLMGWLRDGDPIEFDGSTGWVRRIEQGGADSAGSPPSMSPSSEIVLPMDAAAAQWPGVIS